MNERMYEVIASSTAGTILSVFGGVWAIFWLAVAGIWLVGWWGMLVKAGRPGWEALIPGYNVCIILRIVGRPGWWLVLLAVPGLNVVISYIVAQDMARAFGKSKRFAVIGLWLFNAVGYMILGNDDALYRGPDTRRKDS